jgi:RNA polymerase sigma factor (sigma-70 family)
MRLDRRVSPWVAGEGGERDVAVGDQDSMPLGPPDEERGGVSEHGRAERNQTSLDRRFSQGDPAAVATVATLVGRVVKYRGYYIPFDERPDVIQETILNLVSAVKERSFADDEDFNAFIRTVAYRRCIDWTRRATHRARIDPMLVQRIQPDDVLLTEERRDLAVEIFSELKQPCRELLALRVGRGLTYGQISQLLDRREGALRTQFYYCLKQARAILKRRRRRRTLFRLADWRRK